MDRQESAMAKYVMTNVHLSPDDKHLKEQRHQETIFIDGQQAVRWQKSKSGSHYVPGQYEQARVVDVLHRTVIRDCV